MSFRASPDLSGRVEESNPIIQDDKQKKTASRGLFCVRKVVAAIVLWITGVARYFKVV